MILSKSFAKEVLFVMYLSLFCFMFPLATFFLKTLIFDAENYGFNTHCYYFITGILFLSSVCFFLLREKNEKLILFIPDSKISYVILNLLGFILFPILLKGYVDSNFSKDVYEGVAVAADFVLSSIYIIFLNGVAICYFLVFFLFERFFPAYLNKIRKLLYTIGCIICILLFVYTLYHIYEGRFYLVNSEFLSVYTIFAISSKKVKKC